MSEEEIIGKLKLWMEYASINNGNSCIVNNAELQGLLDLYDKEKEKNKELEVINKMQEYRISVIDERELISKSKVKEEIKEVDIQLQKLKDELTGRKTNFVNKNMLFAKKEALQSLLGKE